MCSLLLRQRREYLASDPTNPTLQSPSLSIDSLVIIDRNVDLATPLCTQLTYEGLVDEVVGIQSAHVDVDPSLVSDERKQDTNASGSTTPVAPTSRKTKKVRLDQANDPLFASIRDENFAIVGERLHNAAKQLNEDYEKRHTARTVAEMRAFVNRLGGLTKAHSSLRLHTGLTERIMEYTTREIFNASLELQQNIVAGIDLSEQLANIEDLILAEAPMLMVIRLLCLLSVVGGGIKPKNLEHITREILQTYGYHHLGLLNMLAKTELLTRATPSSTRSSTGFQAARGPLRLVVDDVDERDPSDISYVYSGYAPLSVRLVQAVAQKDALLSRSTASTSASLPRAHPIMGWRGYEDVLRCLPGASFDEIPTRTQGRDGSLPLRDDQHDAGAGHTDSLHDVSAAAKRVNTVSPHAATTTTMVFFLGGVTMAEIAALRFMSMQTRNRRFVVATTNIISGDAMIRTLDGS